MRKLRVLYLFIFLFVFASCGENSETTPNETFFEEEKELQNVAYGDDPQQKYDIYLPKNRSSSKTKVIILIHGGGWVQGDKADMNGVYDYLKFAASEYALVNINYRLATLTRQPFPTQIDDIKAIVEDLKSKNLEYGILNEYAFVGVSAGAHLSMLYGYKYDSDKEVKAVVDVVGPTDFLHSSYTNSSNAETQQIVLAMQLLVGKSIANEPSYFEGISPRYAVTASSPPTIMFYGGVDTLVPFEQGEVLQQTLESFGVTHQYHFYTTAGHDLGDENIVDALTKSINFIQTHLK